MRTLFRKKSAIAYLGLLTLTGVLLNTGISPIAFAIEPISTTTVLAIWTDCSYYNKTEAANFATAMHSIWTKITILHGCIEPDHQLDTRFDYENWQNQLGLSQYQTLFITATNNDFFSTADYDGYTYPDMKIGFYKQEYSSNTFLLSHELLHLGLYDLSHGDFTCWSLGVHEHYYYDKHPQTVSVNIGNGWTKTYNIVEHFECQGESV